MKVANAARNGLDFISVRSASLPASVILEKWSALFLSETAGRSVADERRAASLSVMNPLQRMLDVWALVDN